MSERLTDASAELLRATERIDACIREFGDDAVSACAEHYDAMLRVELALAELMDDRTADEKQAAIDRGLEIVNLVIENQQLQDARTRLAAVEAERDALAQALMDAPNDAVIMAIDLGMREKFPRSGAFHLEDPMHVIWKAVYEATMDATAREENGSE